MTYKIHFCRDPQNETIKTFLKPFIAVLGDVPLEKADIIVPVGGDGTMLHAFHHAASNQKIFGIVPPQSRSAAYWLHRGVETPDQLLSELVAAQEYKICALRGDILFQDGKNITITAYNEIAPGQSQGEHSDQTMRARLDVQENGLTIASGEVEGGGLILAMPYGSSAMNMLYGGAITDIRNSSIVVSGKGLRGPKGIFSSAVLSDDTEIDLTFLETKKRPVRVQYDGMKVSADLSNPMEKIHIYRDESLSIRLLLSEPPATRALAHLL